MTAGGVDPEGALVGLGFTRLESRIYCELLRHSPLTGYKLAQAVGMAPANVYQPLKALAGKGAILLNEGMDGASTYVPVPPDRLLSGLANAYQERQEAALAALETVHSPAADAIVSQLRTVPQVLDYARAMIAGATEVLVFDCMPPVHALLRDELEAARARGVEIAGLVYRPEDAGPNVAYAAAAAEVIGARWPGVGLLLVVDAREQLIALVSHDFARVVNAVYSDSLFLSCIMHNVMVADIRLVALRADLAHPERALAMIGGTPPGLRQMMMQAEALDAAAQ